MMRIGVIGNVLSIGNGLLKPGICGERRELGVRCRVCGGGEKIGKRDEEAE